MTTGSYVTISISIVFVLLLVIIGSDSRTKLLSLLHIYQKEKQQCRSSLVVIIKRSIRITANIQLGISLCGI